MIDFHKIQSSDFQSVVDLLDASFPVSRSFIERDLKEIQKHPKANGDIYGLWVDATLVGTAIYGSIYGTTSNQPDGEAWEGEGLIRYLAIHPEHRRKGYATWITQKVIEDLKEVGSPCVGVCVWVQDTVAAKIWEDFGFQKYADTFTDEFGFTHQAYGLWFEGER